MMKQNEKSSTKTYALKGKDVIAAYSIDKQTEKDINEKKSWKLNWDIMEKKTKERIASVVICADPEDYSARIQFESLTGEDLTEKLAQAIKIMTEWVFGRPEIFYVIMEQDDRLPMLGDILKAQEFTGEGVYTKEAPPTSYMTIGMMLGMSIGVSLGISSDHLAIGMCLGLSLGMVWGAVIDASIRKKRDGIKKKRQHTES